MKIDLSDKTLLAYLEGEVTQSEAAAIEAALADAPADQRRLERLRDMLGHLAAAPDELGEIDLVPALRRAITAAPAPAPRRRQAWPFLAMAAVMLLAASGLVANRLGGAQQAASRDPEFRPKSGGENTAAAASDRWVGVTAYRVAADAPPDTLADAPPQPLGEHMRQGDGLLFSFDNLGPTPFAYLMIFAVDSAGAVYWFYPAYEQAGTDPASIAIRGRGQRAVELPDLIRHAVPAGPLAIYGVFTHAPLQVSRVEAAIAALVRAGTWSARQPPRLAIPDAGQEVVAVQVDP